MSDNMPENEGQRRGGSLTLQNEKNASQPLKIV